MARITFRLLRTTTVALLVAWMVPASAKADPLQLTRVKPADPEMRRLVLDGYARSSTLSALVDELQTSNALVVIQFGSCANGWVRSCVSNVSHDGRTLHIRIKVSPRTTEDRLIATIGHELQHAVEIVRDPDAVDAASTLKLYRRIGTADCRNGVTDKCETEAAVAAERQVLDELSRASRR